ncbi:MAG: site-2 protease family protein [Acidimicrobiales bacterium]
MASDDALDRPPTYGYGPPPAPGSPPAPSFGSPPAASFGSPPAASFDSLHPGGGFGSPPAPARRRLPVRPSPAFGLLVAVVAAAGSYLWTAGDVVSTPMRVAIFVFVAVGWTVSLCVHEFAHAATAWKGGDRSVEARGYLTLDPRRYMDRQLSIVLPIIIVLIGGIGLPGGAVMIDRRLIPGRGMRSLVSAAGPLTNLGFALACAAPLEFHWFAGHGVLLSALAFLAFLEMAATVLNALPVPGLDGFGVLAPWLPDETVAALMPISQYAFFGLFILLFYSAQANVAFFRFCFRMTSAIGVPTDAAQTGMLLFRFWQHH